MPNISLSALVESLDIPCREALEAAAVACVARGGYEITLDDYIEALLSLQGLRDILAQFERSEARLRELLAKNRPPAGRHSGRPTFSPLLYQFLQEAFLLSRLELKQERVDVGALILALLQNPARYALFPFFQEFKEIPADRLRSLLDGLREDSRPSRPGEGGQGQSALSQYATDFTEEARAGKVDPVFARGPEIRLMTDILTRRRKNNPILVGDPGVGKTAVVEGLARKIAEGDVPDALKGARVVGLDMGRLQAGASVKGEFEKRLKAVIDEVKSSAVPTIMFIDEAHTLVGSGQQAGGGDGANLLKPALARGEMRTIAATTWSEYKKYFEKDAALARRFQLVKLDEPSLAETVTILRGLAPHYEKTHRVYVRDDAVVRAAELAGRYISGRCLPDKAIDVLDTACARVRVSLGAKPAPLEALEEEHAAALRELTALGRDRERGVPALPGEDRDGRLAALESRTKAAAERMADLRARWQRENELVRAIIAQRVDAAPVRAIDPESEPDGEAAPPDEAAPAPKETLADKARTDEARTDEAPAEERRAEEALADETDAGAATESPGPAAAPEAASPEAQAPDAAADPALLARRLAELQGDAPLVFYEVSPRLVTDIVSEWTGVPAAKMNGNGASAAAGLADALRRRVRGQDQALRAIEQAALAAHAGLDNPSRPTGIFLFVGPSGVGKTETALAVADELYGGERMLISINMSEFQEKHTVSRLIGSPPGYVGYGEGGRLTEAVRRQPYSAVLFDEVEKAHPDVLNLFYQVFDKGILADGEGREVDFRNTMIFMTSNLGGDIIAALCDEGESPDPDQVLEALRPALAQFFRPALLGRMTVVPFMPINPAIMQELATMKLARVAERLRRRHRLDMSWADQVAESIAASCTAVDTGARNIDHVINAGLLPRLATTLLGSLGDAGPAPRGLRIGLDAGSGVFTCDPM